MTTTAKAPRARRAKKSDDVEVKLSIESYDLTASGTIPRARPKKRKSEPAIPEAAREILNARTLARLAAAGLIVVEADTIERLRRERRATVNKHARDIDALDQMIREEREKQSVMARAHAAELGRASGQLAAVLTAILDGAPVTMTAIDERLRAALDRVVATARENSELRRLESIEISAAVCCADNEREVARLRERLSAWELGNTARLLGIAPDQLEAVRGVLRGLVAIMDEHPRVTWDARALAWDAAGRPLLTAAGIDEAARAGGER